MGHAEHHGRVARNAHLQVSLESSINDLAHLSLVKASGTLDGDGLTLHWLRPVPPIDYAQAQLRIVGPDTIEIVAQSGRQRPEGRTGEAPGLWGSPFAAVYADHRRRASRPVRRDRARGGRLASGHDRAAENPRLQLLSNHPVDLRDPAGQVAVKISLHLPLENKVQMDRSRSAQSALGRRASERDRRGPGSHQGNLDLEASNSGMTDGRAVLAVIKFAAWRGDGFPVRPAFAGVTEIQRVGQRDGGAARRGGS